MLYLIMSNVRQEKREVYVHSLYAMTKSFVSKYPADIKALKFLLIKILANVCAFKRQTVLKKKRNIKTTPSNWKMGIIKHSDAMLFV